MMYIIKFELSCSITNYKPFEKFHFYETLKRLLKVGETDFSRVPVNIYLSRVSNHIELSLVSCRYPVGDNHGLFVLTYMQARDLLEVLIEEKIINDSE